MGNKIVIISLVILLISIFAAYQLHAVLFYEHPIPQMEETWWGPGERPAKENNKIDIFKISVKNEVLEDLKNRLSHHRNFVAPLEGIQHQYGLNTILLNKIIDHWSTKYNWREQEKFLNQYPQYKTNIQGLNIHYLHIKPKATKSLKVYPLLLVHGWPGSVREFYEIVPLLTTPQKNRKYVFELIIPSLPGYGFSDAAVRPGLGAAQMAVVFKNLMVRLGFEKYFVQGGDWGAVITNLMAAFYPDNILGTHSNACLSMTPLSQIKTLFHSLYPKLVMEGVHVNKICPLSEKLSYIMLESGYMHLQATKPDTVGVALNDSPSGLAAYIIEKFITWTNYEWKERLDGGLIEKYTFDKLLDNVMIYWISGSITTSMRLYAETNNKTQMSAMYDRVPITVPSGCARFSYDLIYQPDSVLKDRYRQLLHTGDYLGGHFAAFELPEILADDIFQFVDKVLKK